MAEYHGIQKLLNIRFSIALECRQMEIQQMFKHTKHLGV